MSRCPYQPAKLRCVREEHPEDPTAHIREADPTDSHYEADDPE